MNRQKGITIIGMPWSGKSTIGKLLADRLHYDFIDLDLFIKELEGESHDEIMRKRGEGELLRLEERFTLELELEGCVFAPGGSIIYSAPAVRKLRGDTTVFYLELPFQEIERRHNKFERRAGLLAKRGIIGLGEKGIKKLFEERVPLNVAAAHYIIPCHKLSEKDIIKRIITYLP